MNWHQARTLAEDHQSRYGITAAAPPRKPRRSARRARGAVRDLGLSLAVGRPGRSVAA